MALVALLACRGGRLAASAAQDALWAGKPVEAKTMWNLVASTRRGLGVFGDGSPVMPASDRTRGMLRLDARVRTDLDVLAEGLPPIAALPSVEALERLRGLVGLVEGAPFDAAGYDWAHRDQDVATANRLIVDAVEQVVKLAIDAGEWTVGREALARGLRSLPGDEELYRARMRLEDRAGNRAAIRAAFDELTAYLVEFDAEPSPVTTALFRELTWSRSPLTATADRVDSAYRPRWRGSAFGQRSGGGRRVG